VAVEVDFLVVPEILFSNKFGASNSSGKMLLFSNQLDFELVGGTRGQHYSSICLEKTSLLQNICFRRIELGLVTFSKGIWVPMILEPH
jgi:hypothetical protein